MQIPVFVEPVKGNGFRAKGAEPFAFTVEGATREEAVGKFRELVVGKLSAGGEVLQLEVPARGHAWLNMAGLWDKDDPLVQEWEQIMAENRRKADEEPDHL
jgi:hypothetical protein